MSVINLGIVGNCQSADVAKLLRRCMRLQPTAVVDVNAHGTPQYEAAVDRIKSKTAVDYVISQTIGPDFPEVCNEALRPIYGDRFLTYTNMFFSGLHPDILYIGDFGQRVHSPLGDYNSKLIFTCFIHRLSPQQCLRNFNAKVYESLGYFRAFDESMAELDRRDQHTDIKFGSIFRELTRHTRTMLSVNHPTPATIVQLCKCICDHFGVDHADLSVDVFASELSEGPVWPIYPELREYHRLPYETPMLFYPMLCADQPPMTLPDFIEQSYASYENYGYERLCAFEAGRNVAAFALPTG